MCVPFELARCSILILFFFCKQKTAYEMRISDWSSDVCSSDLGDAGKSCAAGRLDRRSLPAVRLRLLCLRLRQRDAEEPAEEPQRAGRGAGRPEEIGRASCRERVCQYV